MKSSIAAPSTTLPPPSARRRTGPRDACALGLGLIGMALAVAADSTVARREAERLWRLGDRAAAVQRVDRALGEQPTDPALRFLRAVLLADGGQGKEAEALYLELTRDFPELPEPFNNLAVLHAARGELDAARALLEEALRRDPGYAVAQENLGDVLLRQAQRAYADAAGAPRARPELLRKLDAVRAIATTPVASPPRP